MLFSKSSSYPPNFIIFEFRLGYEIARDKILPLIWTKI
jgi:hypothetical protein